VAQGIGGDAQCEKQWAPGRSGGRRCSPMQPVAGRCASSARWRHFWGFDPPSSLRVGGSNPSWRANKSGVRSRCAPKSNRSAAQPPAIATVRAFPLFGVVRRRWVIARRIAICRDEKSTSCQRNVSASPRRAPVASRKCNTGANRGSCSRATATPSRCSARGEPTKHQGG